MVTMGVSPIPTHRANMDQQESPLAPPTRVSPSCVDQPEEVACTSMSTPDVFLLVVVVVSPLAIGIIGTVVIERFMTQEAYDREEKYKH